MLNLTIETAITFPFTMNSAGETQSKYIYIFFNTIVALGLEYMIPCMPAEFATSRTTQWSTVQDSLCYSIFKYR